MKKIIISFLLVAALVVLPVFAGDVEMLPLSMPTAASDGFGGPHIGYTDNVFSLLVNPAAMIRVQQRSFFTLAPTVYNPQSTVDLANSLGGLAQGDTSALGNAASTLSKQKGKIVLGAELREFPLSFAWVANGFGFGLWNRSYTNLNIVGTNVEANVYEDVMLPIGFAFKILNTDRHSIDAGITLKPFARVMATDQEEIINLISDSTDFTDTINAPIIAGGSFDVGFLYRWAGGFSAGFTFNDIYSRGVVVGNLNDKYTDNNSYYFPFTMNLGVSYEFKLFNFMGFALAADWRDIRNAFNQDDYLRRNYQLDFGVGLQLSLFDVLRLRVGMNEMLPSCGVGLDLGPCKIDLAYYGREFGREPGQLSAAAVDLSISIRPGAQKRDWPWARRSVVGLFTGQEAVTPAGAK